MRVIIITSVRFTGRPVDTLVRLKAP